MLTTRYLFLALLTFMAACWTDDKLEDFWPDPQERTEVYFGGIQEALSAYWEKRAMLPANLVQLTDSLDHHGVMLDDGWENPIRYSRFPDGYCLASAGADSTSGTEDDLVVGGIVAERTLSHSDDRAIEQCRSRM